MLVLSLLSPAWISMIASCTIRVGTVLGHQHHPLQALCVCLNSVWVQVKLQWDEDDEACGVCGDDEQAEGYATPHVLLLCSALCCCIAVHSCCLSSSAWITWCVVMTPCRHSLLFFVLLRCYLFLLPARFCIDQSVYCHQTLQS